MPPILCYPELVAYYFIKNVRQTVSSACETKRKQICIDFWGISDIIKMKRPPKDGRLHTQHRTRLKEVKKSHLVPADGSFFFLSRKCKTNVATCTIMRIIFTITLMTSSILASHRLSEGGRIKFNLHKAVAILLPNTTNLVGSEGNHLFHISYTPTKLAKIG